MHGTPLQPTMARIQQIVNRPLDYFRSRKQILFCLAITNLIRLLLSLALKIRIDRCMAHELSNSLTLVVLATHFFHMVNMVPSAVYLIEDTWYNMVYVVSVETLLCLG